MAKAQAYELMKDAEDVCRMIGDGDNLPEWLEAKITLASDYMNKVKDYLSNYEMKGMHEGILNEIPASTFIDDNLLTCAINHHKCGLP